MADAIVSRHALGLVLYVRIRTSATTSIAVALVEGTGGGVGWYAVSEAALVSAGLTVAGVYAFTVFGGSVPSTTANDVEMAVGELRWTGSAVDSGGGGGIVVPVNQAAIPPSRTWLLIATANGMVGEAAKGLKIGETKPFAIDFRNDLPTNGKLIDFTSIEIAYGEEEVPETPGLTFAETENDPGMGGGSARQYALDNNNFRSTTVAANRLFKLLNSTVSFCRTFCQCNDFAGASGDPINITGNAFNHCAPVFFVNVIGFAESTACSYVNISNNTLDCRYFFDVGNPYQTRTAHDHITINNNSGTSQNWLNAGWYGQLSDGQISGNTIVGLGRSDDGRMFQDPCGAASHPLVIENNTFCCGNRFMSGCQGDVTIRSNVIHTFPHHYITAPASQEEVVAANVLICNNVAFSKTIGDPDGFVELGYNHRSWLDNWQVINNTIGRGIHALVSLGDTNDGGTQHMVTRLVVANNIAYQPTYLIDRNAAAATELEQFHVEWLDGNLGYNPSSAQTNNYNKQATAIQSGVPYNTATRNVAGVALFDPLYSLPETTGRSLVLTHTSATNRTLAWGGGTAVQLVVSSGTATSAANNVENRYGTLTDSGKSWSTTMNSGTVVRAKWVVITGGTGVGQIRGITGNTATRLDVAPVWTTTPDATSTYAVMESEVKLFDSGASNYVRAGIYLPDLPTSSQTDTGITWQTTSLTSNPLLSSPTGSTAAAHQITTGSPAIDAGNATYAPATDYYGTGRPIGSADDLGFYEFPSGGAATGDFFLLLGSCRWRPIDIDPRANPFASFFGALAP